MEYEYCSHSVWTTVLFDKNDYPIKGQIIIRKLDDTLIATGIAEAKYGCHDIEVTIDMDNVNRDILPKNNSSPNMMTITADSYFPKVKFDFYPQNITSEQWKTINQISSTNSQINSGIEVIMNPLDTEIKCDIRPLYSSEGVLLDLYSHK